MEKQREIVVLETLEGSARSERLLKAVWKRRIQENFPHYKLLSASIIKE